MTALGMLVDTHEPDFIIELLTQCIPTTRANLNHALGMADYVWCAADGHVVSYERKQWSEVLSGLDSVEEQLRREAQSTDELNLLIEGVAEPTPHGVCVLQRHKDGTYRGNRHSYGTPSRPVPHLYARVQAWLWELDKCGITVYQSPGQVGTATLLVAHYKASLKPEHTTLQRYIKPRVQTTAQNPQVVSLMGLVGADIGEVRAQALVARFGNLYSVLNAPREELLRVDGIGPGVVKKLWKAIGREVNGGVG